MDSFLTSTSNNKDISQYLKEMYRILKPGCKFIIISHGRPNENNRLEYLRRYIGANNVWNSIEYKSIGKYYSIISKPILYSCNSTVHDIYITYSEANCTRSTRG